MPPTYEKAHDILDRLGVPGSHYIYHRICSVGDRLYLRAEGEPDCADLVGKINEVCDYEGIGEGSPVERVEALAGRCREAASELRLKADRYGHYIDRVHMLEAERAQLAAKATPDSDKLLCDFTRLLISDGNAATEFLALASLAKRMRAALKEGDA